ncbi:hypothetical protein SPRG_09544 [Saprolegnia parasitica CBS 223.65]|uniref:START domain-containing protein n=1 Tax=Saprolegnia parasitica (strain CBS 223.65) TaxID=695850 RepID=A0A067C6V5_SAPPC|nr:hypothetical protein SPRG_09544 [Saprolegnia parasitica CBS 223.65]KDO24900.1 hypothetical protein SPRG_09544 [Saprolegnia parasitica CBS 223.65]|eukprot:XP_012204360.1 hypothetical protein SPRG_09544 [Saprolegnia parasitica CBS 223.65]
METVDDDILALCVPAAGADGDLDAWVAALHSTSIDAATLPDQSMRPAKRRRTSLRDEVLHLRAKHDALTAQLDALTANASAMTTPSSIWADRAKDQAVAAQLALHENARLQELVRDQLKTIAALQRAFARKPKLCDFPCLASWKLATLGTSGRREAKAKLMQHQYELLATEWIRHGLHDIDAQGNDVRKRFMQVVDDALYVHFVECHAYPVDYTVIADAVWGMLTRQLKPQPELYSVAEDVDIDDDIVYIRFLAILDGTAMPPINGRLLARRFVESNRIVFVTRSIVDDALFPSDPGHFHDNQCSWIVVEPRGEKATWLSSYARFAPPTVTDDSTITDVTPGMYTDCILQLMDESGISIFDALQSVMSTTN